jgi:hypothetical protein
MNPNVRNTISKLGPTTFLTPEMLEAAAVAAENWPSRRDNCDRHRLNSGTSEETDNLECHSTWYLPGQGG